MATINLGSITIPDNKAVDISDTVSAYLGWTATVVVNQETGETAPNPVTKLQHIKNKVRDYIKEAYKAGKSQSADVTRITAVSDADAVNMTI